MIKRKSKKMSKLSAAALAAAAAFAIETREAKAVTLYWDGSATGTLGAQGGAGSLDLASSNWWTSVTNANTTYTNVNTTDMFFGAIGGAANFPGSVQAFTANTVTIDAANYSIAGAGGTTNTIALSGANNSTSSPNFIANYDVTIQFNAAGGTNDLNGTSGLYKSGAGKLTLAAQGTGFSFTGGVGVTGGKLSIQADNNLGNTSNSVTLANGGQLLNGLSSGFSSSRSILLGTGGGVIGADVTSSNTFTGSITLAGVVSNAPSQVGSLTKANVNTVVLTGADNYTGSTNAWAGTLLISGSGTIQKTSGVNVRSTSTVSIDNATNTSNRLNDGANFAPVSLLGGSMTVTANTGVVTGTEAAGTLTVDRGQSVLTHSKTAGNNSTSTLTFSSFARAGKGVARIDGTNLGKAATVSTPAAQTKLGDGGASLTLIGNATVAGQTDLKVVPYLYGDNSGTGGTSLSGVTYDSSTGFRPLDWGTEYALAAGTPVATTNYKISGANFTQTTNGTANSLLFTSPNTWQLNASELMVASGQIVYGGSGTAKIGGGAGVGTLNFGTNEGVVIVRPAQTFQIGQDSTQIFVKGSGGLTLAGGGTLEITSNVANWQLTGNTTINGGTLKLNAASVLGTGADVTINGGILSGNGTTHTFNSLTINQGVAGQLANGSGTYVLGRAGASGAALTIGQSTATVDISSANVTFSGTNPIMDVSQGFVPSNTANVAFGPDLSIAGKITTAAGGLHKTGAGWVRFQNGGTAYASNDGQFYIDNGTVQFAGNDLSTMFASQTINIGDTTGSNNATLVATSSNKVNIPIVSRSGSSGVNTIDFSQSTGNHQFTVALQKDIVLRQAGTGAPTLDNVALATGGTQFNVVKTGSGVLVMNFPTTSAYSVVVADGEMREQGAGGWTGNLTVGDGVGAPASALFAFTGNAFNPGTASNLAIKRDGRFNAAVAGHSFGSLSIDRGIFDNNSSNTETFAGGLTMTAGIINAASPVRFGGDISVTSDPTFALAARMTGSSTIGMTTAGQSTSRVISVTTNTGAAATDLDVAAQIINGAGTLTNLIKTGNGVLQFSRTAGNTYTAPTLINAGTIRVTNTSGSATGTAAVTINSGGTLAGSGIISGGVTVNSGGTVSPGLSPGKITTGAETWNGGGNYKWEMSDGTVANKGLNPGYDWLTMSGALTQNNTSGSKFNINVYSVGTVTNLPGVSTNYIIASSNVAISGGVTAAAYNIDQTNWLMDGAWSGPINVTDTVANNAIALTFSPGNNSQIKIDLPANDDGAGGTNKTVAFGRNMTGTSLSAAVQINKTGGSVTSFVGTIAGSALGSVNPNPLSTSSFGGNIAAGSSTLTLNVGLSTAVTGAFNSGNTVTIDNLATTSAGTGLGSADNNDVISVTGTIVDKRVVSASTVTGNFLKNATVGQLGVSSLTSPGSDNNFTRVNVAITPSGPDSNGVSLTSGTLGLFDGSASGSRSLSGLITTSSGLKTGGFNQAVTTAENGGSGLVGEGAYAPVAVNYSSNVGLADADNNNTRNSYTGTVLNGVVSNFGSYQSLESKVEGIVGSAGAGTLRSIATIRQGRNTAGTDRTVSETWRTRNHIDATHEEVGFGSQPPFTSGGQHLASDIIRLTGMETQGNRTIGVANEFGRRFVTDTYTLQMGYDGASMGDESGAAVGRIFLAWLDPDPPANVDGTSDNATFDNADDRWVNAVDGNFTVGDVVVANYQGGWDAFKAAHAGDNWGVEGIGINDFTVHHYLGSWGVDTNDFIDTDRGGNSPVTYGGAVWAVLDHNSVSSTLGS